MWPQRFALLSLACASCTSCTSCAPTAVDEPVVYPAPEVNASCVTSPTLCGLTLHDLGGGDHPNAFHIVLIGDGYLDDEQLYFEWSANALAATIQRPDGFFVRTDLVTRAPELFHFWRVDVPSDTIEVDDATLTNTPLGAHLGPPDLCVGSPLIHAIEDRFAVALDNATLVAVEDDDTAARRRWGREDQGDGDLRLDEVSAWPGAPVTSSRATFVMLSHRSIGRGNGTFGGNVRISGSDGTETMAHELGHALFHLADEYTEFDTCEPPPMPITCGPPPDISEVGLLERANTSTLHDGSKWSNDVDSSRDGGNRWPCHAHATDACLMLGAGPLCPACASAVEERFARRRCEQDIRPPRVAIEKDPTVFAGGTRALVAASAFDERALGSQSLSLAWTVDGAPLVDAYGVVARGPFAVLDLAAIDGREVRATASDPFFTHASSPVALLAPFEGSLDGDGDEGDEHLELAALQVAGLSATLRNDSSGDLVQIVRGVGDRFAVGIRPQSCVRVMRAGAFVRINGGPEHAKEISLPPQGVYAGCDATTSEMLFLTLEPMSDSGDTLEVRGFAFDDRGRSAETDAWQPTLVDPTTCDLDVVVRRANGAALPTAAAGDDEVLGAFDAIVARPQTDQAVRVDVRVARVRVPALPMGAYASSGVAVMPIGLPTSTGNAIEVDFIGLCAIEADGIDNAVWATASAPVEVRWDNEPPAIAAQTSIAPRADAWEMMIVDDSAIASVTITPPPTKDAASAPQPIVLTAPPWRLSPPLLGEATITAVDVVGNQSTRVVTVSQQSALDEDVVCPAGSAR